MQTGRWSWCGETLSVTNLPPAVVIKARRYAANGTALGPAYTVLTDALDLRDPMLTVLRSGRLVMQDLKHNGTPTTIAGIFVAVSFDNGRTFTERSKVPFTWPDPSQLARGKSSSPLPVNGSSPRTVEPLQRSGTSG